LIAYIADQDTANVIELFSSEPKGIINNRVSGTLVSGGDIEEFKWAPDDSGIAYIADQDTNETFELYASDPNGNNNTKLSGILISGGDVFSFDWVP
jgi:hypothetical protein